MAQDRRTVDKTGEDGGAWLNNLWNYGLGGDFGSVIPQQARVGGFGGFPAGAKGTKDTKLY